MRVRPFSLVLLFLIVVPSVYGSIRMGPNDFDWFIKDAAPTGPSDFKVRTTGYWIALEEDWTGWYTGAKIPEGKSSCGISYNERGFYEDVRCEGSGISNDGTIYSWCKDDTCIAPTKEASKGTSVQNWRQSKSDRPPVRPKRTIAVNLVENTPCYIPRYSRVYIKYPQPNHPMTGWYIAEDTGGAFKGKCKIDVFMGIGKQGVLRSPNPTVSATDESQWPEVWVFPGKKTDDLWDDNIVTYIAGKPSTGLASGEGGVPASATAAVAKTGEAGYRPTHPYFSVPYSVNPSFSTTIPYDFSIYDTIPKQLSKLERCKDDIDCVLGNITEIEASDASYDWIVKYGGNVMTKDKEGNSELPAWEAFCEKPDQHAVNSITEAIDVCARSIDKDCICSYELPVVSPAELDKWYGRAFSSYLTIIPIIGPILGIASFAATELSESSSWTERTIGFLQSGKNIRVFMRAPGTANAQEVATANFKEVASGLRGSSASEMKYLISDTGKSVDIYKDKNSNLTIYPSGEAPSKTKCELHTKVLKFCIVQNKTFFAYNSQDNRMGLQQLVLKFAYVFSSKASDVRGFNVYDAKMASNTSLLVWDAAEGIDASQYTIYYSENPGMEANLALQNPAELDESLKKDIMSVQLSVSDKQEVRIDTTLSIYNPYCTFSQLLCERTYQLDTATSGDTSAVLSDKTLYYSTLDNKFFYFLSGIRDDYKYFYGLTVTDTSGSESPSFNLPEKSENAKDDIPPGIASILSAEVDSASGEVVVLASPISTKMDGSPMESQASKVKLYCFDGSVSEPDLSGKTGLYAAVQNIDESTTRLSRPLADFNSYNCGFTQSPQTVKVVAVGVQTVQGVEIEFTGKLPADAFSASFSVPESG